MINKIFRLILQKKATILLFAFLFGLISIPLFQNKFFALFSSATIPIANKCIVIDAGHGGPDGGAKNKEVGALEKEITLKIALYLRDYLQEAGAYVIMTREFDTDLYDPDNHTKSRRKAEDLMKRVKLTVDKKADAMISLHLNAILSNKCSGAQTFFNPINEENQKLATFIQDEIKRSLENTTRAPKKKNDIYILRESTIPTSLVEVGFISHPNESRLLIDTSYQKKLAASIYYGIARFFVGTS